MILTIRHETVYHYTAPLAYTIQQLRLSPRTARRDCRAQRKIVNCRLCSESPPGI